jgi:hypothetical protein|mmetsp:Transcript_63258/g.104493  ORF Transcript_63258/g.104493 Transcript_63258/m.104493 type:complete len:219 (-) Transcript_63258:1623-2279(-)
MVRCGLDLLLHTGGWNSGEWFQPTLATAAAGLSRTTVCNPWAPVAPCQRLLRLASTLAYTQASIPTQDACVCACMWVCTRCVLRKQTNARRARTHMRAHSRPRAGACTHMTHIQDARQTERRNIISGKCTNTEGKTAPIKEYRIQRCAPIQGTSRHGSPMPQHNWHTPETAMNHPTQKQILICSRPCRHCCRRPCNTNQLAFVHHQHTVGWCNCTHCI